MTEIAEGGLKAKHPLQARREELGFSLRDVQEMTDGEVSNAYLSQVERGKIKHPSIHICLCLASVYAVSLDTIGEWVSADWVPPKSCVCPTCGRPTKMQFAIDNAARQPDPRVSALVEALEQAPHHKGCDSYYTYNGPHGLVQGKCDCLNGKALAAFKGVPTHEA